MEFVQAVGVMMSFLMVVGFFKVWYLVGCIRDSASLANQKLAFQTGLLERCVRALEGPAGKPPGPSTPVDQIPVPVEKGLSLGGYNR